MKLPVLIAARNEEAYIGKTLDALDAATTEPIVIVNGSTDETANIARGFGAEVYERDEPGKMRALQHGLRQLGDRALGPVLLTDADTQPIYPKCWAPTMLRSLGATASVTCGLALAERDSPWFERKVIGAIRLARVADKRLRRIPHAVGYNMGIRIGDTKTLENIFALDNYWPGEDAAILDHVSNFDRDKQRLTLSPFAMVRTSSRYKPKISEIMRLGRRGVMQRASEQWNSRAAGDARPYERWAAEFIQKDDRIRSSSPL